MKMPEKCLKRQSKSLLILGSTPQEKSKACCYMAEAYMEATGNSLYDRDGYIDISVHILEYYEAIKENE